MEFSHFDWHVQIILCLCSPQLFQRCFPSHLTLITLSGRPATSAPAKPHPVLPPPHHPPGDGTVHSYEASSFTSLSHRLGLVQWERQIRVFIIWPLSWDSPHSISPSLSLSIRLKGLFLNRETVQLMAVASFCLLFWFSTPFISFFPQTITARGHGRPLQSIGCSPSFSF